MKKIALLALSLAFIFTLTACSPNANVSNQTDTTPLLPILQLTILVLPILPKRLL